MTVQSVREIVDVLAMNPAIEMPVQGLDCKVSEQRIKQGSRGPFVGLTLVDLNDPRIAIDCTWFDCPYLNPNELLGCRLFIRARAAKDDPNKLVGAKVGTRTWTKKDGAPASAPQVTISMSETVRKILRADGTELPDPMTRAAQGTAAQAEQPAPDSAPTPSPIDPNAWFRAQEYAFKQCAQLFDGRHDGDPSQAIARMTNNAMMAWKEHLWEPPPPTATGSDPAPTPTSAPPTDDDIPF